MVRKTERIRRLLAAAMGECDSSALARVRTDILRAMRALDSAEEVRRERKAKAGANPATPRSLGGDPRRSVEFLDAMIRSEADKLSEVRPDELLNG